MRLGDAAGSGRTVAVMATPLTVVTPSFSPTGGLVADHARALAEHLCQDRTVVVLVAGSDGQDAPGEQEVTAPGGGVFTVRRFGGGRGGLRGLRKAVADLSGPKVVTHVLDASSPVFTAAVSAAKGPVVASPLYSEGGPVRRGKPVGARAVRKAAGVLGLTEQEAQLLRRDFGVQIVRVVGPRDGVPVDWANVAARCAVMHNAVTAG